jgi:hypothetical protein
VAVTQHPLGSADRVFLDACRVCLSQQYHRVQHNLYLLKRNKKEDKIKCRKPFPKDLDCFPLQLNTAKFFSKPNPAPYYKILYK